jgi:hypothetical protein
MWDKIGQAGWGRWIGHGGVFDFFSLEALFFWEREMARGGKNKAGTKKGDGVLELLGHLPVSNTSRGFG